MRDKIKNNLILVAAIGFTIFTVMPILAPLFAYLGLKPIASAIYWFYQWTCHQRPWRSYHLFDYQYAMDARMMLMFGSIAVSSFIIHFKNITPLKKSTAFIFGISMALPLAIDGTVQAIAELSRFSSMSLPFYESTNLTRSLVGILFGVGFAFSVLPFLNVVFIDQYERSKLKNLIKSILVSIFISLLIIPMIVFMWFITSNTYKPSNMFFDHERRFPGYNYEITTSAGHSTINRLINIDDERKYLERAKYYNKEDLMEKYYNEKSK